MLGEKKGVIYNGVLYNSTEDYPKLAPLPPYPPGSGKASDAGESMPDESTPDESRPDESMSEENIPDDSTPDENTSSGKGTTSGNQDIPDSGAMDLAPSGVALLVGLMFCMGLL
jgi:hypothetical protein